MPTLGDTNHGPASVATTRTRNVCSEILRIYVHTAGCYAAASSANESSQQIKSLLGRIYNFEPYFAGQCFLMSPHIQYLNLQN